MTANPKPRFQFHLSSAIVLMIAASVMLGLNFHKNPILIFIDGWDTRGFLLHERGWPMTLRATSTLPLIVDAAFWILTLFLCWYFAEEHFRKAADAPVADVRGEWIRVAMFCAVACYFVVMNLFPLFRNWNEWCQEWFVYGWPAMYLSERSGGFRPPASEWNLESLFGNALAAAVLIAAIFPLYRHIVHPIALRLRIAHRFSWPARVAVFLCAVIFAILSVALFKQSKVGNVTTSKVFEHRFIQRRWGWPFCAQMVMTHEVLMNGEMIQQEIVTPDRTWLRSIPIAEARQIIAGSTDDSNPRALTYNFLIAAAIALACGWIFEVAFIVMRKVRQVRRPDP